MRRMTHPFIYIFRESRCDDHDHHDAHQCRDNVAIPPKHVYVAHDDKSKETTKKRGWERVLSALPIGPRVWKPERRKIDDRSFYKLKKYFRQLARPHTL